MIKILGPTVLENINFNFAYLDEIGPLWVFYQS